MATKGDATITAYNEASDRAASLRFDMAVLVATLRDSERKRQYETKRMIADIETNRMIAHIMDSLTDAIEDTSHFPNRDAYLADVTDKAIRLVSAIDGDIHYADYWCSVGECCIICGTPLEHNDDSLVCDGCHSRDHTNGQGWTEYDEPI